MAALIAPWLLITILAVGLFYSLRYGEKWRQRAARNQDERDQEFRLRKEDRAKHIGWKIDLAAAKDRVTLLEGRLAKLSTERTADEGPGCGKVRLFNRDQAHEFVASLAKDTNQPTDWFTAYLCKVCPRQPVGTARYWHVGHIDPEERTRGTQSKRKAAYHKRGTTPGARVGERLDADAIDRLKARFATGGAA